MFRRPKQPAILLLLLVLITLIGNPATHVSHAQPLIQSATINYLTYYGGTGNEPVLDVRALPTNDGGIIVFGRTESNDYPTTTGQPGDSVSPDCAITKFAADGSVSYSRYLGGDGIENCRAAAIGPDGFLYVAGMTNDIVSFASKNGVTARRATDVGFLAKVNTSNGTIATFTSFGGMTGATAVPYSLTVIAAEVVLIGGWTDQPDLLVGSPSFHGTFNGARDGFLLRFENGVQKWGSFIGSGDDDYITDVATNATTTFVSGFTASTTSGSERAFLIGIDGAGIAFNEAIPYGASVDRILPTANGLLTVGTTSTQVVATVGEYQTQIGGTGGYDSWLGSYDLATGQQQWGTLLGGSGTDYGKAIALHGQNIVLVGGERSSNFPGTTGSPVHETTFISEMTGDGKQLLSTTLFNGGNPFGGEAWNVSADSSGGLIVSGYTMDESLPVTSNAAQKKLNGSQSDMFIARMTLPSILPAQLSVVEVSHSQPIPIGSGPSLVLFKSNYTPGAQPSSYKVECLDGVPAVTNQPDDGRLELFWNCQWDAPGQPVALRTIVVNVLDASGKVIISKSAYFSQQGPPGSKWILDLPLVRR